MKELVCINCPNSCLLQVGDCGGILKVSGNKCRRGEEYARAELTHPLRTVTTTVRLVNSPYTRCPVKTSLPVPRELIGQIMSLADKVEISVPVQPGQVILHRLCGTDADLVATSYFFESK